jgi:hypothetical protein
VQALVSRRATPHRGELARARKAMDQQEAESVVRLERDPATGVYSPKHH